MRFWNSGVKNCLHVRWIKRIEPISYKNSASRVAWIALILAKMEGVTNTDKILKMALLHDIAESRTGDVNYLQRQYVVRNEDMGFADIVKDTVLEEELLVLWKEYEAKKSIESRIVKDADHLDVDFELQEQRSKGSVLAHEWKEGRYKMLQEKLYTKSAKKLLDSLLATNPHDWHNKARNRFNKGDWGKGK